MLSTAPGGVMLTVRLTPNGGADRIDGAGTDAAGRSFLKARVRAAPEDGAANAALEALLAQTLKRPKSSVQLIKGHTQRIKTLMLSGLDESTVRAALLKSAAQSD